MSTSTFVAWSSTVRLASLTHLTLRKKARLQKPMEPATLKSYVAPWKSEVLLACRRCQKKLRKSKNAPDVAQLRKWLKSRDKEAKTASLLHLIELPCQKICPKNSIVVFTPGQLATTPARFSIISNGRQMEALYRSLTGSDAEAG